MRVILDTNILISGIFWSSHPRKILRLWLEGNLFLVVSVPILIEYRTALERISRKYGKSDIFYEWELYIKKLSEIIEPEKIKSVCRDPKDDMFLEAAVGGNVDFIITGDKDLLCLNEISRIPIISCNYFLNYIIDGR